MPAASTMRAVVVSWNGAHLLPECLDSLLAQDVPGGLEVVVVDNASQDGTPDLLRTRYPQVGVVRTARNLGFAGGVVEGTRDFGGDWVLLLNNDATLDPGAAAALLRTLTAPDASRVAAATAKILLAPTSAPVGSGRVVNSTGNVVTTAGTGTDRDWLAAEGAESHDPDVFGFCGGAALLRASALREVGGFDASLFLYYEDTDLSWRLRAAGWDVRYCPDAVALHRHASSSGTDSPVFRYFNTRNSLVVFGRHAPVRVVLASFARQCAGLLRAAVRDGVTSPVVRARARALRDVVLRTPRTLHERRRMWRDAVVPRGVVARYLTPPAATTR